MSGRSDGNMRFTDLCDLLTHLGFACRIEGSHHIYVRKGVLELINLQTDRGRAKQYQVRQVRMTLRRYKLGGAPE